MLDAIETLPKDTEDNAVQESAARRPGNPFFNGATAIGAWGALPWGTTPFGFGAAANWEHQRVFAAAMMMTPFAMAQSSTLAMRKARALTKGWREAAARCKTMRELIDVNSAYGERAIALGAGEMWRMLERSAQLGRAAAAPGGLAMRQPAAPEAEAEPALAKAG